MVVHVHYTFEKKLRCPENLVAPLNKKSYPFPCFGKTRHPCGRGGGGGWIKTKMSLHCNIMIRILFYIAL